MTTVYLIHFETAYKHARHYLGATCDLRARLKQHERGNGAKLIQVISRNDIRFVVARVWFDADFLLEKKLKGRHNGVKLCPICRGQVHPGYSIDIRRATIQRATTFPLAVHQGNRRPMHDRMI